MLIKISLVVSEKIGNVLVLIIQDIEYHSLSVTYGRSVVVSVVFHQYM